jgi:hypothetical protein
MDFADEVADNKGDAQVATPMIIATMDMERAHIAGYEGQQFIMRKMASCFILSECW